MEISTIFSLPQGYWIALVALLIIFACIGGGKGGGGIFNQKNETV